MESGAGSQGDGNSRGFRRALMFVMITTNVQWAASERNKNITVDSLGPWDKDLFKIQRRCLDFHWENLSTYFFYWPEDDPHADFQHCCTSDPYKLPKYTYGIYGPNLGASPYYDLGLIEQCLPYWKCSHLFQTFFRINLHWVYCEMTDLLKLYRRRFVVRTVLKHGLLQSAIPLIVSLEILVIFSVALYWCIWRRPVNGSRSFVKDASGAWFRHIRKTLLGDWTHLCLLAIVGNGFVEAMGRQNPYTSQSKSFYNYARLYVVLSVLVWYSSVLQQVAYAIAEIEMHYRAAAGQNQVAYVPSTAPPATSPPLTILSRQPSVMSALQVILGLNDDWKWQPIAAQAGILFCLWGFLTYTVDDVTTGAVFGLVVGAACPRSGLYASKVIICAFPWLLRRVYKVSLGGIFHGCGALSCTCNGCEVGSPGDSTEFVELVSPQFKSEQV